MNVLSLFAGIGGIELGLERAGMTTVGQVEIDPWCRKVLAKHWPNVPQHDDVVTAPEWWLSESRPNVDLVCGGFPCQPFSLAGKQLGIGDPRWMWPAMAAIIRVVRPSYVLVENDTAGVDGESRDRMESSRVRRTPLTAGGLFSLAVHQRRQQASQWLASEPSVARLADGVPEQVDRLHGLGNAVVPQIPEHIGRQIMARGSAVAA